MLLGLQATPKEDCGVLAAELVYGAALSLLAEFLPTAEPPAGEFLQKLQCVEMPATRPLSYAKVVAKLPAALLQAATCMCGVAAPFRLWRPSTWGHTWSELASFSGLR